MGSEMCIRDSSEVVAARLHHRRTGIFVQVGPQGPAICDRTTRTVTSAFSESMRTMDIHVVWDPPGPGSGRHCQGTFLSRCVPYHSPSLPPLDADENAFLALAWRSVYRAVGATLRGFSGSDVSRFDSEGLRFELRSSLVPVGPGQVQVGSWSQP